jgi:hypothetical protein
MLRVLLIFYRHFLLLILVLAAACGTRAPSTPPVAQQDASVTEPEPAETRSAAPTAPSEAARPPAAGVGPHKPFPESVLGAPELDRASPELRYETVLLARGSETAAPAGWEFRKNTRQQIVGFEFSNRGGNRVLPQRYDIAKNRLYTRDFQFRFDDRARQDIHFAITDWAPASNRQFKLSELMNSVLLFFPRNYLPAIVSSGGRYIVTLPTGEQAEFDAASREIVGGVFSEGPVDLSPNRATRKFPAVSYIGRGVSVRVNARGVDPRIATTATISNGSGGGCGQGAGCNQCQVPSQELWQQTGAVRFRFPSDAEFDRYLRVRCGFGLPTLPLSLTS